MNRLESAKKSVLEIAQSRYPDAKAVLFSGSVLRGNDSPFSDLDIIALYEKLPNAKRESFYFNDWPIEAFIHDPETLRYFCEEFDLKTFVPILASMLKESIVVYGDENFAKPLQYYASTLLKNGPAALTENDHQRMRYAITDMIDDIRQPKGLAERQASVAVLYTKLSDYFFRSRRMWCARSKTIPRLMREIDSVFAEKFISTFNQAFIGDTAALIQLTEEVLKPYGGFLFDGYCQEAPLNARK